MEGTYSEHFVMHCSPWEGEVCEVVSYGRDPTLSRGRSFPPEEETAAKTTCDGLIITPIPVSLLLEAEGDRESGIKLSLGRRKGWERMVFLRFDFAFHYPSLISLVIN